MLRSVALECPLDDEHPVTVARCCQLLQTADVLESLHGPALGEDDVDFETVADLSENGRGVAPSAREARSHVGQATHLDVALSRACEGIDDDLENV